MKRIALYILILVSLVGCVQYDEELWINRDGSGKARVRIVHRSQYDNPEEILQKSSMPGIHLINYDIKRKGGDVYYTIYFKFSNIEAFNNINDKLGNADFWGKITLNKGRGRNITFKRRISLGSLEGDDDFEDLLRTQYTKHPTWKYKLHVPWKIISANALSENVDEKSRIISWSYDTGFMWNKTQYMTVEMRKSFPWFVLALGFVGLILMTIMVVWLVKIAKRSHLLDWLHHDEQTTK
ncbi:MAG: hypothetical protein CVU48_09140 [Candidatus Cloacimonetes bacterium HGW-Cloacimonetes-1]|jgi:hypothetical protein|nr:MAG: hypothetical protein CVU48_09140 [Candidatus Cloacimonetes bacterium HGW-Cloacimonetes-1]